MRNRIAIALSLAAAAALFPAIAWSQATVVTLTSGGKSLDSTEKVLLVRGFEETRPLRRNDLLKVGERLQGPSGEVSVELLCAGGSRITLSRPFDVAVSPPLGRDCTIDLRSGAAHFLSAPGQETGGQVGETAFASESTWYEVARDGETLRTEINVYEGKVEAVTQVGEGRRRAARWEFLAALASDKLVVGRGVYEVARVTTEDRLRTAEIYTSVSLSKVPPQARADEKAVHDQFYQAYTAVLAEPQKAESHLRLGAVQLRYQLPDEALLRLDPTKIAARGDDRLTATATLLRSVAYQQLGEVSKAEALRKDAYRIDPQVERHAEPYMIRPVLPIVLRPLTLETSGHPPQVAPGQSTRIAVWVGAGGSAVAGADVKLSAGGGAFANGELQIKGQTDAAGIFAATWSCRPCVPAYRISVEASKAGYQAAKGSVTIAVRPP